MTKDLTPGKSAIVLFSDSVYYCCVLGSLAWLLKFCGFFIADIDECALRTHTCWNDSACINLAGGFDCLCPSGPSCSGDCPHEGGLKHNGQVWILREDRCSVCSCKVRLTGCSGGHVLLLLHPAQVSFCPGAHKSLTFQRGLSSLIYNIAGG